MPEFPSGIQTWHASKLCNAACKAAVTHTNTRFLTNFHFFHSKDWKNFTPPSTSTPPITPWPPLPFGIPIANYPLMFPSFPKPAVGAKKAFWDRFSCRNRVATQNRLHCSKGACNAAGALISALSSWPARSCMTVNQTWAIRRECQDKMQGSLQCVVTATGAHLKNFFPVHETMVHQSSPSYENLSSRKQRKRFCTQVPLKLTIVGLRNVSYNHPSHFLFAWHSSPCLAPYKCKPG